MKTIKIKTQHYKRFLKNSTFMPLVLSLSSCSQQSTHALSSKKDKSTLLVKYTLKNTTQQFEQSIQEAIENSIDISKLNGKRDWLYIAVKSGDIQAVKVILKRIGDDKETNQQKQLLYENDFPNRIDAHSQKTPLGKAIDMKLKEIVKLLIQDPAIDVYNTGTNNINALLLALHNKNEEMAFTILSNALEKEDESIKMLQAKDQSGNTPLHLAIKHSYTNVAKQLIEKLPIDALYIKDKKKRSALHMAARYNRIDLFDKIFDKIKTTAGTDIVIYKLFEKDVKDRSVWACAYLPKSKHGFIRTKILDHILTLTADNNQSMEICIQQEIEKLRQEKHINDREARILAYRSIKQNGKKANDASQSNYHNSNISASSTDISFASENSSNVLHEQRQPTASNMALHSKPTLSPVQPYRYPRTNPQ